MPDFDLDSALQAEPEWEPWDVFQRISGHLIDHRHDWVSRSERYWVKKDGSMLAKTTAHDILDLPRTGYIGMLFANVPNHPPNAQLVAEIADSYNRYPHEIDELSLEEQWMMALAYYRNLPGRSAISRISEAEFRATFPT